MAESKSAALPLGDTPKDKKTGTDTGTQRIIETRIPLRICNCICISDSPRIIVKNKKSQNFSFWIFLCGKSLAN